MKLKNLVTYSVVAALAIGLSGCSAGAPKALGGKCSLILTSIETIRANVSPEYDDKYTDLLKTVHVYDNYALNDVLGDLLDLYYNGEDQLGSASNYEVFMDWFKGIQTMNENAYASGQYADFFSSDMGPFNLKSGYSDFNAGSLDLEEICSAD